MPQEIINGILVTFTGDPLRKAVDVVGMFDRLAVRPIMEDEKREPVEAPAMPELPISESRKV